MAVLKCKMCGGELTIDSGSTICECEYCGSKQTIPGTDDEKRLKLYERANRLRFECEFDKAAGVYESIVSEFQEEAEAYWGLVLCKYGIEYVDDPATARKVPTCHRLSFDCVIDDRYFEMVMETADTVARGLYREQAKQIEEIRKKIIEVSSTEEPYDIFICYKETAEDGDRTVDSVIAQDVYDELTEKGYRVFFSRITLEDMIGKEYEPYIFAALNSAKVMLAFGTTYDYFNAVWVKNEWSRFLKLIADGQKKTLIPCYKDIDAYDIPKEFRHLQAQDMGKVGAIQDLIRGINKIFGRTEKIGKEQNKENVADMVAASTPNNNNGLDALLERGFLLLEDEDFEKANELFEDVLNQNPKCASAYMGQLMVYYKMKDVPTFSSLVFHNLCLEKTITITWEPQFDIIKMIEDSYIFSDEVTPDVYELINEGIKQEYETNIDSLREWDEHVDYVEMFCELNDEIGNKKTTDDNKLYARFKQYATEEEKKRFGVNANVAELVKKELQSEEAKVIALTDDYHGKYTEAFFSSIIDCANRKIKKKLAEKYGEECHTRLDEYEKSITEYKMRSKQIEDDYLEECRRISEDWPGYCQGKLSEWENECNKLKSEYSARKEQDDRYNEEAREYNMKVETLYQNELAAYESEQRQLELQIENLITEKSRLTSFFKKKEREEIENKIQKLQTQKTSQRPPIIGIKREFKVTEALVLPEKPVFSDKPVMPKKPELTKIENNLVNDVGWKKALKDSFSEKGINLSKVHIRNIRIQNKIEELFKTDKEGNVIFGNYKGTKLKWRVTCAEKDRVLLICENVIDVSAYNEDYVDITWADCTLRKYLNKDFISGTFSQEESKLICAVKNLNPGNKEFETRGGKETVDKVFCLSIEEVEKYFRYDSDRMAKPTKYAGEVDNEYLGRDKETGCAEWWLRSPGERMDCAAIVEGTGTILGTGISVGEDYIGVRPALWLRL